MTGYTFEWGHAASTEAYEHEGEVCGYDLAAQMRSRCPAGCALAVATFIADVAPGIGRARADMLAAGATMADADAWENAVSTILHRSARFWAELRLDAI